MDSVSSTSKRKQNLEGLLRLAVEHSGPGDLDSKSNPCETDEKRNEFLQSALTTMTTGGSANDLEYALANLKSASISIAEKKECLDIIRSYIDDIDHANSLVKNGGITTLLEFIRKPDNDLRTESICIVAEMAQNNVFCQNYFLTANIIPVLASTMNNADAHLAKSSIYAISSIIQNFTPGLNEFLRINGINILLSCLSSTHKAVYIKAAHLIGFLSSTEGSVRDLINRRNAASILLNNLENKDEYDDKLEATLSALSSLTLKGKWNITQKQHDEAVSILKQIVNNKNLLDSCEEMIHFARNILNSMITNKK